MWHNSMKKDTTLISYRKARLTPPILEETESPQVKRSKLTSSSVVKSASTSQLENWMNKLLPNLLPTINRRYSFIKQNLIKEFFLGSAFLYPFTIFTHKVYWSQILIFAGCYICIFLIIASIYYIFIVPPVLAWAIVTLGPLGIVIVHIQWLLQANALTGMVSRKIILTHINNQIFDTTLFLHGEKEFLRKAKFIKVSAQPKKFHWSRYEFWVTTVPAKALTLMRKAMITILLALISLIPLVGPPITNQLVSARRAYSYMGRYFTLKGCNEKEAKDFEYEHLGLFLSFGMAAGILEFIPLFSIITITSNTVGAAKWCIDIIEKS